MDNDLPECPNCLDIYGNKQDHIKAPKVLSCGDSVCKECLFELIKNNITDFFECPRCKKQIEKKEKIDEYIPNNDLIRLISSSFRIHESEIEKEEGTKICSYNIISLGDSAVGKTCIFQRLLNEEFREDYKPTLGGINYNIPYYMKFKKQKYKLLFWDTGGQEKFHSLTKNYFRKVDGVLFVFDLSDIKSFYNLTSWIELYELERVDEKMVGVLIGNKCDKNRQVNIDEAKKFAEDHGLKYFETSAKLDKKIKKAIVSLLESIIESKSQNNISNKIDSLNVDNNERFELNPEMHQENEKLWNRICRLLNPKNWFN